LWSTLLTATITATVNPHYGFVCWAAVAALAALFGAFCRRKIGGITGDTLGAAIEIAECLVLLVALLL
ncbi:MAG: adenosylcobinamide-GDP ribazoletransferase, partial [Acidobacteriia bacterium]|nr:adenosylcobinamide-GDP ribazoletransferase [Terriglobia bacterium]